MGERPNTVRGEAEIMLGGTRRRLVPSYANLVAVEEATGRGLVTLARSLAAGEAKLGDVAKIVAVASEPKITEDEAGQALSREGLMPALTGVAAFLVAALNGGREGKETAAEEKS